MPEEASEWERDELKECVAVVRGDRGVPNRSKRYSRDTTPSGAPVDAPVPQFAGLEYVEEKLRDSAKLYQYRHGADMLEKLCAVIVAEAHAAERT